MNQYHDQYKKDIVPKLMKDFGITNAMAVPHLVKIVVNCGIGEALKDKKVVQHMVDQLAVITGQKPVVVKSRKAISTFKLRIGDPVGIKVTMRGSRMYDFLVKLVSLALPRVRDFSGIPLRGFDGRGSYTLGMPEQTIFPELDFQLIDKPRGFEITFVTTATNKEQTKALLTYMGMPFAKGN